MTILVTGGVGFIGGHTVLALLDRGEIPVVLVICLIVRSSILIVHEPIPVVVFANFASEDSQPLKAAAYQGELIRRVDQYLGNAPRRLAAGAPAPAGSPLLRPSQRAPREQSVDSTPKNWLRFASLAPGQFTHSE